MFLNSLFSMWHNASKTIFPLGHFHQKSLSKLAFKVDGESYMSFLPSALAFTVSSDISRTPAISSVQLESKRAHFPWRSQVDMQKYHRLSSRKMWSPLELETDTFVQI